MKNRTQTNVNSSVYSGNFSQNQGVIKTSFIYPAIHRHQCVIIYCRPVVTLYGADRLRTQQLEDGVVFPVLEQIHGVPGHRIIHRKHKVQHVFLYRCSEHYTSFNSYHSDVDICQPVFMDSTLNVLQHHKGRISSCFLLNFEERSFGQLSNL